MLLHSTVVYPSWNCFLVLPLWYPTSCCTILLYCSSLIGLVIPRKTVQVKFVLYIDSTLNTSKWTCVLKCATLLMHVFSIWYSAYGTVRIACCSCIHGECYTVHDVYWAVCVWHVCCTFVHGKYSITICMPIYCACCIYYSVHAVEYTCILQYTLHVWCILYSGIHTYSTWWIY